MTEPRLQVEITKKSVEYENHEEEWSEGERSKLLSLWEQNLNLIDITEKLQRPKHQIIQTLFALDELSLISEHSKIIEEYHSIKK